MGLVEDLPGVLGWACGHAPSVKNVLDPRPWTSPWLPLKTIDSILRGIAQVCFADNPLSGALILAGLLLGDVYAGLGAIVCSLTAIFTALLFQQPSGAISAGLTNFSAVLVGTVTASLYPLFFHQPLTPIVWGYMILASVFSVCLGSGLGAILSTFRLPAYTLPFNIATALTFIALRARGIAGNPPDTSESIAVDQDIQFDKVCLGALLSVGQVYAVEDVLCSCLTVLGLLICSPILTLFCLVGATTATVTALAVSSAPYTLVYAGVWGYNGLLSAACLSFFMVPTARVFLLAIINAAFTTFLQAACIPVFSVNQLPVFTFPFCTSSLIILAMATAGGLDSPRVEVLTFPEQHLHKHRQSQQSTASESEKKARFGCFSNGLSDLISCPSSVCCGSR